MAFPGGCGGVSPLRPPGVLPPHVQRVLGEEKPVFAVEGRQAGPSAGVTLLYVGLLFLLTPAYVLLVEGPGMLGVASVVVFAAFALLGLFLLRVAARHAFARAWFVGTPAALHVVTAKDAARHAWGDLVPDVTVRQPRPGRGSVTIPLRPDPAQLPAPRSGGTRLRLSTVSMARLDDAPALARACLRLLRAAHDAPAPPAAPPAAPADQAPRRAAPSPLPSTEGGLPGPVARVLGGARPDFALRSRTTTEERVKLLLTLAALGGLLVLLGLFTLFSAGAFGPSSEGVETRAYGGITVTHRWDNEIAPHAVPVLVAWFLVPVGLGFALTLWRGVASLRRGRWFVAAPEALLVHEPASDVRVVAWERVGEGVRVLGRDVLVPLRPASPQMPPGTHPETLVLVGVPDPQRVRALLEARRGAAGGAAP